YGSRESFSLLLRRELRPYGARPSRRTRPSQPRARSSGWVRVGPARARGCDGRVLRLGLAPYGLSSRLKSRENDSRDPYWLARRAEAPSSPAPATTPVHRSPYEPLDLKRASTRMIDLRAETLSMDRLELLTWMTRNAFPAVALLASVLALLAWALISGSSSWTGGGFNVSGPEMPWLKEMLALRAGMVVADVGAGKGQLTLALAGARHSSRSRHDRVVVSSVSGSSDSDHAVHRI